MNDKTCLMYREKTPDYVEDNDYPQHLFGDCIAKNVEHVAGMVKTCDDCKCRETLEDAISTYEHDEYGSLAKIYSIYKKVPKCKWHEYEQYFSSILENELAKLDSQPGSNINVYLPGGGRKSYSYEITNSEGVASGRKKIPKKILKLAREKGRFMTRADLFLNAVAPKLGISPRKLKFSLMAYAAAECEERQSCPYKPLLR